jgi:hypothetical protein
MYPKRDSEGFAIDEYSNTVEDAGKFQQHYNGHLLTPDYEDYSDDEDSVNEEEEDDYDDCGCSDPCCPCGGSKRGCP